MRHFTDVCDWSSPDKEKTNAASNKSSNKWVNQCVSCAFVI